MKTVRDAANIDDFVDNEDELFAWEWEKADEVAHAFYMAITGRDNKFHCSEYFRFFYLFLLRIVDPFVHSHPLSETVTRLHGQIQEIEKFFIDNKDRINYGSGEQCDSPFDNTPEGCGEDQDKTFWQETEDQKGNRAHEEESPHGAHRAAGKKTLH